MRPGEGDDEGGGDGRAKAAPTAIDNRAQVLLAKSTDGGNTFSAPVKVADYYDLPDCVTYQGADPGRACVPEKGETLQLDLPGRQLSGRGGQPRATPARSWSRSPRTSTATPRRATGACRRATTRTRSSRSTTGVKTPGACNNDIVDQPIDERAARRSPVARPTCARCRPTRAADNQTDQFWQWAAFNPSGQLAVSYYDRGYGSDETTGFSDISLSGSRNGTDFATTRVTSASMPPPTQFEGTFFGDYSGLSAGGDAAHPFWMDTRDPNLFVCRDSAGNVTLPPSVCTASAEQAAVANDQNVYTRGLTIPLP